LIRIRETLAVFLQVLYRTPKRAEKGAANEEPSREKLLAKVHTFCKKMSTGWRKEDLLFINSSAWLPPASGTRVAVLY